MAKKYAVCVGLNYPNTSAQLSGCANDAQDWEQALASRGFTDYRWLLGDTAGTAGGGKANILRVLEQAVVELPRSGDTVVVTNSSHGTRVPDQDGDEADRYDEAWCPADCFDGQLITDDELYGIFRRRRRGVRLVFISDSCHSGTLARLAPAGLPADPHAPKMRFLPPGQLPHLERHKALRGEDAVLPPPKPSKARRLLESTALMLSGCADFEFSFDAWFNNRANGAMTRAALDALAALPVGATYRQWHAEIRKRLPTIEYPQSPQLVGTSAQKKWRAAA